MKYCIPFLFILGLFGCSKEEIDPATEIVHLAGSLQLSNMDGDKVASYWKDGVYTALTNEGVQSETASLYVDESTVFIGGEKRVPNSLSNSVMWRNGAETVIEGAFGSAMVASHNGNTYRVWLGKTSGWTFDKNGAAEIIRDTAYTFGPLAMAVSGDDVYLSGYSSGRSSSPDDSPPTHAQCWKNGQLIFREKESSNALSIFINQNDIYMAGYVYSINPPSTSACYWKNGQLVKLTDGSKTAISKSIYVTDTNVFVAGMMDNQAVYWKDGEIVSLTTEGMSMANSIFVRRNDVHVGGSEQGYPAYWKNDVRQTIVNQNKPGQIKFVVAGSN
jgi:hypothetical protein